METLDMRKYFMNYDSNIPVTACVRRIVLEHIKVRD